MVATVMIGLMIQAATAATVDLSRGPVTTTTVAATVWLDAQGRVERCAPGATGPIACTAFKKGRVVSPPLRRNGRPARGKMTLSTTTIISG